MIKQLLAIAERKENKAFSAYNQQKKVVEEAEQRITQCQQILTEYQAWRPQEENRLFESLSQQLCHSKELNEFQAKLAALLQEENDLCKQLLDAKAYLSEQQKALTLSFDYYQTATQKTQKFKECAERQRLEQQAEQLLKQEADQEDQTLSLQNKEFQL